jgi:predicted RNase H-like HicB family nuclease
MKDKYIFPAIFESNEYGVAVEFPDLPGCYTCADNVDDALRYAKEALELHLYGMEKDGDDIPEPSNLFALKSGANQRILLIEAWMPMVRLEQQNKAVKKTLTIPAWLEALAEEKHVNFSQILQAALKQHLGLDVNTNELSSDSHSHHDII